MASIARKRLKKIVQMNKKLLEQNDKESTIFTDERYRMPVCCHGTENLHYLFYNLITFITSLALEGDCLWFDQVPSAHFQAFRNKYISLS